MIDKNSTKEEVLEAVKQKGSALLYASYELQGDRDVVLEAVQRYGLALMYASEELRADPEIVLAAVRESRHSVRYAGEEVIEEMAVCWAEWYRTHRLHQKYGDKK